MTCRKFVLMVLSILVYAIACYYIIFHRLKYVYLLSGRQVKMTIPGRREDTVAHRNSSTSSSRMHVPSSNTTNTALNNTKIVAAINYAYKDIAVMWHKRMTELGYTKHVVATVDEESHAYLTERNLKVETILPRTSNHWPLPMGKPQVNRRRIFGTRWVHAMAQLRSGYNVLLTDVDNIFNRYLPMEEMEASGFDIIHVYANDFPVRFLSMGFTVCGCMTWIRASSPAIRFVQSVLQDCSWGGDMNRMAQCDDQQVLNKHFFFNTLNYTYYNERPTNESFWKHSLEGKSLVTGHTFKILDVDTAYRGPIDGKDGVCPKNNWVAMPLNSIQDPTNLNHIHDPSEERTLRYSQWPKYCGGH